MVVAPCYLVTSRNLTIDEEAQDPTADVDTVWLVAPGDVPFVLDEDFCEHSVNTADVFDSSV